MVDEDIRIIEFLPFNIKVDIDIFDESLLKIGNLNGIDNDLANLADNVKKYFNKVIKKNYDKNCGARNSGILLKIKNQECRRKQDYYLHIYGDYEWAEKPRTSIRALRKYVSEKTKSPEFTMKQAASRFGFYMRERI